MMNITLDTWMKRPWKDETKSRLKETVIGQLIPLTDLNRENKEQLIAQSTIKIHPIGTEILKEGSSDEYIYYLLEGKVELTARGKTTLSVFGGTERARQPISTECPYRYSIRSATSVIIFMVERDLLDSKLQSQKF